MCVREREREIKQWRRHIFGCEMSCSKIRVENRTHLHNQSGHRWLQCSSSAEDEVLSGLAEPQAVSLCSGRERKE